MPQLKLTTMSRLGSHDLFSTYVSFSSCQLCFMFKCRFTRSSLSRFGSQFTLAILSRVEYRFRSVNCDIWLRLQSCSRLRNCHTNHCRVTDHPRELVVPFAPFHALDIVTPLAPVYVSSRVYGTWEESEGEPAAVKQELGFCGWFSISLSIFSCVKRSVSADRQSTWRRCQKSRQRQEYLTMSKTLTVKT